MQSSCSVPNSPPVFAVMYSGVSKFVLFEVLDKRSYGKFYSMCKSACHCVYRCWDIQHHEANIDPVGLCKIAICRSKGERAVRLCENEHC